MKRDEILAMKAGRELDCLVIQRVFKKLLWDERPNWYFSDGTPTSSEREYCKVPRFSTDISAAWEVVKGMQKRYFCETAMSQLEDGSFGWMARFIWINDEPYWTKGFKAVGHHAPEAICKAALLAVLDE